ncbi:MAG: thioredoxin domain-containing protein [Cyanobacteria bacterium]|nr:thioredoxin domain-containing protein [Cyanobacteriota bacterium]MDW8199952.1 thioredoxin domain-containing protein [Cyanobacteriota bacterium SKYGB_h_bin112]
MPYCDRWVKCVARCLAVLLSSLWLSWAMPALAVVDSQFEAQVLDVIRAHPEAILESVQRYEQQQQSQRQQAQAAALRPYQTNPRAIIGQSPVLGAPQRQIVLVEFSDFQCPYCARVHDTLQQFMTAHQRQVTLVYKHYPLSQIHPQAIAAAKAAWAAGQQGRFWDYHDRLFANQAQLGEDLYIALARQLHLDEQRFNADRVSQRAAQAIQSDMQLGDRLGIQGTPFFLMNGVPFAGAISLDELEARLAQFEGSTA